MKKVFALLLPLALVFGLLAGCGQTEPAPKEDGDTAGQEKLQKIVITEDVRGYHWAPAYLAQTLG